MVCASCEGLQTIDVHASAFQELVKFSAIVIQKNLLNGYCNAVGVGPQAIADPIHIGAPLPFVEAEPPTQGPAKA